MVLISQPGSDYQITSISLDAGYTRDLILMLTDVHAVLDHLYLDGTQPEITSPAEDYLRESASPYSLPALIDALGEATDQLSRAGDFAKKGGIELSRRRSFARRPRWRWRSTQTLGKSEELAPRLIHGRGIVPIGFVRLAYVSVVKDARDRVGAHNPKFNCALLSLAHLREG